MPLATKVTSKTIISTRLGDTYAQVIDNVSESDLGDARWFSFHFLDHEGELIREHDFQKLSEAMAELHKTSMTEFAGSVYVTDCEDEDAFAAFA